MASREVGQDGLELLERAHAADEVVGLRDWGGGGGRGARSDWRVEPVGPLDHSGDEPKTASVHRLDDALSLAVVADRAPYFPNRASDRGVPHHRSVPHGLEQLLSRHELVRVANEE